MDLLLLLLFLVLICENALKISSTKNCSIADCEFNWSYFGSHDEYEAHTNSFDPSNSSYLGNRVNMSGAYLKTYVTLSDGPQWRTSWLMKDDLENDESEYIAALDLSYTDLASIHVNVFAHFPCLTDLYLHGNKLTKFYEQSFNGLDNLKVLNLSNNQISSLSNSNLFKPLSKLEILDLSKNNLKEWHLEAFVYLVNLRQLFIKNNDINNVVDFRPIPDDNSGEFGRSRVYQIAYQLSDLDLENNRLDKFDTLTFSRFHFLKRINLVGNNIRKIIFNDAIVFPHVIYVNISHNQLSDLDAQGFRKTFPNNNVLLDFNGNTIVCAARQVLLPALKRLNVHIREYELPYVHPYLICTINYDEYENYTISQLMNRTKWNIPRPMQLQLFSADITQELNNNGPVEIAFFVAVVISIIFAIALTFCVLSGRCIPDCSRIFRRRRRRRHGSEETRCLEESFDRRHTPRRY